MSQIKTKRSASKNPFYIMATIYGENTDEIDLSLHRQNRDVWNAWACQGLSKDEKDDLQKTYQGLIIPDWTKDLQKTVNDAFAKRLPGGPIPSHNNDIDFKDTDFEQTVGFGGFLFLKNADFSDVHFTNEAYFCSAKFTNEAYFYSANFMAKACFTSVRFKSNADFKDAEFTEEVNFYGTHFGTHSQGTVSFSEVVFNGDAIFSFAIFEGYANFIEAKFKGKTNFLKVEFRSDAEFWSTEFIGETEFRGVVFDRLVNLQNSRFEANSYFHGAQFYGISCFTDASFAQPANFEEVHFTNRYPVLKGTNLHSKTTLTAKANHWPKIAEYLRGSGKLENAAASCAHLRHNMTAQGLPDDAHFFFRREMGCKLAMAGGVKKLPLWLYGKLSDYGYSYGRPLGGLIWLWLLWTLVYTPYFLSQEQVETLATKTTALAKAAGLSFANIFVFFGFHKRFDMKWSGDSNWLIAFTGLETILGFILLFFLGLGLRNQFRLK